MVRKLFSSQTIFFGVSIMINIILVGFIIASPAPRAAEKQENATQFPFLSPRVFMENQNDLLINFTPLRTQLQTYITPLKERTGMYFEYLPSGTSIGVNEKETFVFASLLKTPLVMGIYKQYENKTLFPDKVVTVEEKHLDPAFGSLWKKGAGGKYPVDELVTLSIVDSDNTASNVLFDLLPEGTIESIFDSLDIPKELERNAPVVTPKNYSSVLRSLYLSSILTKDHSNQILEKLTKTNFPYPTSYIPKTIPVAHKIGVYGSSEPNLWIYSDCGIFYPPKRPYILCIMTQTNSTNAYRIMTDISSMVYAYVTK